MIVRDNNLFANSRQLIAKITSASCSCLPLYRFRFHGIAKYSRAEIAL
jgi:hypothetical protein